MKAPTYCAGCSFKCIATGCECTCHDKMRKYNEKYNQKKSSRVETGKTNEVSVKKTHSSDNLKNKIENKIIDLEINEIMDQKWDKNGCENKILGYGCYFTEHAGNCTTMYVERAESLQQLIKLIDKRIRKNKYIHLNTFEKLIYKMKQTIGVWR